MKLKIYPETKKPQAGDYRIDKVFAWTPRKVENKRIWLEYYKKVYQYKFRDRYVYCQGYGVIDVVYCGGWDLITEQLISK